jgi:hypothetical protein
MRRLALVAAMVGAILVVAAPVPAHAGGSTFTFARPWYRPGDHAVGHADFWVRHGYRTLPGGPFYAELVLQPKWWNHVLTFPPNAIRLSRVRIRPTADPKIGLATLAFRVPDVPPGEYGIAPCISPCDGMYDVGDLVGGWFVVGSPVERQLEADRRATENDLRELASDQAATARGLQALRRTSRAETASLRRQLAELRPAPGPGWTRVAGWIAAGAFVVVALGLAVTMRRRRPKVPPPGAFARPGDGVRPDDEVRLRAGP